MRNAEDIKSEINLGATICSKIKLLYFAEIPWVDCYKLIAAKFTDLKKIAHSMYVEKSTIEILKELNKYSAEDIRDLFDAI